MSLTDALLDTPAGRTVRLVALEQLDRLHIERARLGAASDDQALHDFRVALRRLRSWLRAWRPLLDDTLSKRSRRGLSELADASDASRDLEVAREWLGAQAGAVGIPLRGALDVLAAALDARRRAADAALARAVAAGFDETAAKLRAELSRRRALEDVLAPRPEPSFASACALAVREHADALAAQLAQVRSIEDQAAAHAARIEGKRLRYLLEPLRETLPVSRRVVTRLRSLQDVLGEMHDADVLAGMQRTLAGDLRRRRVPLATARALLAALAMRNERRRLRRFAQLRRSWLGSGARRLAAEALAVAATLAERARRDREIERRFLLSRMPPRATRAPSVMIEQGYLPGTQLVERLRRITDARGATHHVRTVKIGDGLNRMEVEEAATKRLFDALWPLTEGLRVAKRRHRVQAGPLTWEIDRFLERDLVLAEVELPAEDTQAPFPAWLAPHVVREVTLERAYTNRSLAR